MNAPANLAAPGTVAGIRCNLSDLSGYLTAREVFARRSSSGMPSRWEWCQSPEGGVWYDFADATTGNTGQCRLAVDGDRWHQPPLGVCPTILVFRSPTQARRGGA